MSITLKIAKAYLEAGLSVLPVKLKEKHPILPSWNVFQTRLPTPEEIERWFASEREAVCIVCGKVSGNLEVIDFDNKGELFPKWKEAIPTDLLAKLVIEHGTVKKVTELARQEKNGTRVPVPLPVHGEPCPGHR